MKKILKPKILQGKFGNVKQFIGELIRYCYRFGLIDGMKIIISLKSKKEIITLNFSEVKYPVELRKNTSDISVFEQIFLYNDYNFTIKINPKLIIDCGANVGYASIFFANKFPHAHIIAVEPEISNYNILKHNTCQYENIKTIKSAIWNENTFLKIKDIGLGKWCFIVENADKSEDNSFKSITIGQILKDSGFDEIDILKIDVEGSEKEIFGSNYKEWLDMVKILIIELHDKYKPGCTEAFNSAINKYNFSSFQKGGNLILMKR